MSENRCVLDLDRSAQNFVMWEKLKRFSFITVGTCHDKVTDLYFTLMDGDAQ